MSMSKSHVCTCYTYALPGAEGIVISRLAIRPESIFFECPGLRDFLPRRRLDSLSTSICHNRHENSTTLPPPFPPREKLPKPTKISMDHPDRWKSIAPVSDEPGQQRQTPDMKKRRRAVAVACIPCRNGKSKVSLLGSLATCCTANTDEG